MPESSHNTTNRDSSEPQTGKQDYDQLPHWKQRIADTYGEDFYHKRDPNGSLYTVIA